MNWLKQFRMLMPFSVNLYSFLISLSSRSSTCISIDGFKIRQKYFDRWSVSREILSIIFLPWTSTLHQPELAVSASQSSTAWFAYNYLVINCFLCVFIFSDPISAATSMTDENPLETKNLALSGTFVVQGSGQGIVIATGDRTVMGNITKLTSSGTKVTTTLQKELNWFTLTISCIAISFFILSVILWGAVFKIKYPGFETASTAILVMQKNLYFLHWYHFWRVCFQRIRTWKKEDILYSQITVSCPFSRMQLELWLHLFL